MESSRRNLAVAAVTSHGGVLPLDVLFDVLVRLPANEICRLRAVCRPWRSLTSDSAFLKAHAARHPASLVASFRDDPHHVHILDLSGHVIKRMASPSGEALLCSCLDLICFGEREKSVNCCLINPRLAGGGPDREPAYNVFALGRVESTGEYKMLMVSCMTYDCNPNEFDQLCHVLTLNGGTRWRSTVGPEFLVKMEAMDNSVVVSGAVYYLWADSYVYEFQKEFLDDNPLDCIASFDFETESWCSIRVPHLVDDHGGHDDDDDKFDEYIDMWSRSALGELKGYLVMAHNNRCYSSTLDLWFLINIDNGLWVKEYSIQDPGPEALLLYDPTTNVFSEMGTGVRGVTLYTGSLLSSQRVVANV
ncbi:unnamed protein product [Urochloa decumbens]|uniref:F-box domain-containing protein n=1 Tax=Urochloa decumbens TaxID=240449 RepID=A0ABC9BUY5_9POAL